MLQECSGVTHPEAPDCLESCQCANTEGIHEDIISDGDRMRTNNRKNFSAASPCKNWTGTCETVRDTGIRSHVRVKSTLGTQALCSTCCTKIQIVSIPPLILLSTFDTTNRQDELASTHLSQRVH